MKRPQALDSTSRIYRMPTTGYFADKKTIDAGSLQILVNNISHLELESCRNLICQDVANGTFYIKNVNLRDYAYPPTSQQTANQLITWEVNRNCFKRDFFAFADEEPQSYSVNGVCLRKIRVKIRAKSNSSNTLQVSAFLTPLGTSPLDNVDFARSDPIWTAVSTTEETVTLDLVPQALISSDFYRVQYRCNDDFDNGGVVYLLPVTLWIGVSASDISDKTYSVSAWECRE